jgi:hypothetical protein
VPRPDRLTPAGIGDEAAVRRRESGLAQQGVEWRVHDCHAIDLLNFNPACEHRHPDQRAKVLQLDLTIG